MAPRVYALLPIAVLLSLTFSVSANRVKVTEKDLEAGTADKTTKSDEHAATEASCPHVTALVGTWKADRIVSTKSGLTQYWTSTFEKWIKSRRMTISTQFYYDEPTNQGKVGFVDLKPGVILVNIMKEAVGNTSAPPRPRTNYISMNCWCDKAANLNCGIERDEGYWVRQMPFRYYDYNNMKKNDEAQARRLSLVLGPSTSDELHVREEASYSESTQKYGEFDSYFKKMSFDSEPGDDWAQLRDDAADQSYWYNQNAGAFWGMRPPAKPKGADKPKAKPKGPPAESTEDTDLARATNSLLRDLKSTLSQDEDSRKSTYKKMAFQWHPDKNAGSEIATQVFWFLQQQKEWYLPEA